MFLRNCNDITIRLSKESKDSAELTLENMRSSVDPYLVEKENGKYYIYLPTASWATAEAIQALSDFVEGEEVSSSQALTQALLTAETIGAHALAAKIADRLDEIEEQPSVLVVAKPR